MIRLSLLILGVLFVVQGNAVNIKKFHRLVPPAEVREMVEIEGQKFFFGIFDNVAWGEAEVRCSERSMTLVTLDTQEKNDMILNFITDNPIYDFWYWSFGHRLANSSEWFWEGPQQPLTFLDWGPGQPDTGSGQEACLSFASGVSYTAWRGWDDIDCERYTYSYLCEEVSV